MHCGLLLPQTFADPPEVTEWLMSTLFILQVLLAPRESGIGFTVHNKQQQESLLSNREIVSAPIMGKGYTFRLRPLILSCVPLSPAIAWTSFLKVFSVISHIPVIKIRTVVHSLGLDSEADEVSPGGRPEMPKKLLIVDILSRQSLGPWSDVLFRYGLGGKDTPRRVLKYLSPSPIHVTANKPPRDWPE